MDLNSINGIQTPDWISALTASFNLPNFPSTSGSSTSNSNLTASNPASAVNAPSSSKSENSKNSAPKTGPRKIRSYTISQKLEVIRFAKDNSINAAHRKYNIDRKCIRDWRKNEAALLSVQHSTSTSQLKRRRPGAGRRVMDQGFDDELAKWVKSELDIGRRPSRTQIQWKALDLAQQRSDDINTEFKASTGWLEKFLVRHNFHTKAADLFANCDADQPSTSTEDQRQENHFAEFVQYQKEHNGYEEVYVAYKMRLDMDGTGRLIEPTSIHTSPDKFHVTLILTISSDGVKLPPFFIVPLHFCNPQISSRRGQIHWSDTTELDADNLLQYLQQTFELHLPKKRLLLWNDFGCQLSENLSKFLAKNRLGNMLLPEMYGDALATINAAIQHPIHTGLFEQAPERASISTSSLSSSGAVQLSTTLSIIHGVWTTMDASSLTQLFKTKEIKTGMSAMDCGEQSATSNDDIGTVEETYREEYARFLDKIVESIGEKSVKTEENGDLLVPKEENF